MSESSERPRPSPGSVSRPSSRQETVGGETPGPTIGAGGAELPVVSAGAGSRPLDRREVLKLMVLAAAAPGLTSCGPGDAGPDGEAAGAGTTRATGLPGGSSSAAASNPMARGDAWDPDLLQPVLRWEKVLTDDEREGLAVLCDVIVPEDDVSPSASAVGAHDYIDEWVSAPYDFGRRDLVLVRGGLAWLDQESSARFGEGSRFRDLAPPQQRQICDDICWMETARPEHRQAARFFAKVRDLTATAFYTTPEGMADIGYVGNVPSTEWGPPPPEVLRHLGLEMDP
jgi:gluconate 2-dehydrogenase gamma chain